MTNPHQLSDKERNAIHGPGGIVPCLCQLWIKRSETSRNRVTQYHPFKLIETYKCLSKTCPYELRIVRIPGGLVLLEKQKIENGVAVSVARNKGAHDYAIHGDCMVM